MKIIAISGLDGSGKSTQIELLKNYFESQKKACLPAGRRIFYFHAVNFSLANKIHELCHREHNACLPARQEAISNEIAASPATPRNDMQKSVTHANWFQIWLRKIFLKIDICRFDSLRNKLRNNGYDYILSDRYFYDSVINIEYLEKTLTRPSATLSRVRARGIIKPDIAIYLQISPENIMSREKKPDQGIEYLEKKKELYDSKIADWNFKIIDGNRDKEEVFQEIKKLCQAPS